MQNVSFWSRKASTFSILSLGLSPMACSETKASIAAGKGHAIAAAASSTISKPQERAADVPYVPTPQPVVEAMLRLGQVDKQDILYDLGSGDGRIPITAAKKYGAKAVGVDINPMRIEEANANAKKEGVVDKVTFVQEDLFKTDLSKATVVTLYLLSDVNMKLRPTLLKELKPGTHVVSHGFSMGDWTPDKVEKVGGRTVYLWTIPTVIPAHLR